MVFNTASCKWSSRKNICGSFPSAVTKGQNQSRTNRSTRVNKMALKQNDKHGHQNSHKETSDSLIHVTSSFATLKKP